MCIIVEDNIFLMLLNWILRNIRGVWWFKTWHRNKLRWAFYCLEIISAEKKKTMQCLEEQFQLVSLINLGYTSFVTIEEFVRITNREKKSSGRWVVCIAYNKPPEKKNKEQKCINKCFKMNTQGCGDVNPHTDYMTSGSSPNVRTTNCVWLIDNIQLQNTE